MKLFVVLTCVVLCIFTPFIVMDSLIIAKSAEYRDEIKRNSTEFNEAKMDKFETMNNVVFGMSISFLVLMFLRICFLMIEIIISEKDDKFNGASITDLFNLAFAGFLIYFILEFGSGIDSMYYSSIVAFLSTIAVLIVVLIVVLIISAIILLIAITVKIGENKSNEPV